MNLNLSGPINSGSAGSTFGAGVWVRLPLITTTIPLDEYGREKRLTGLRFTLNSIQASWALSPSSLPLSWYSSGSWKIDNNGIIWDGVIFNQQTINGYGGGGSHTGSSSPTSILVVVPLEMANVSQSGNEISVDYFLYVYADYWDDIKTSYFTNFSIDISWSDSFTNVQWFWEESAAPVPEGFTQNTPQMVSNNVSLSWTASQYASAYKVFRAPGTHTSTATGSWTEVANGLTNRYYTDSTVSADTTYTYYIQSSNESGVANSNFLSILTTHAPEAFLQSTPTMNANAVALSWAASTYATSYKIYRAEGVHTSTATGTWSEIATGITETTYEDSAIFLGRTYSYYIKAVNGGGTINSDFENITTAPPSSFAQLELTYITGTYNVKVEWEESTNADSYKVYRLDGYSNDPSSGTWVEKATTTTELTWTDATVELGKTYSYYIKAFNDPLTTNSNPRQISVGMQQQQIL
jgi:fibronectin type 3 domain-containing protein